MCFNSVICIFRKKHEYMLSKKEFLNNIYGKERVSVTPKNYLKKVSLVLVLLMVALGSINLFILFTFEITYLNLGFLAFVNITLGYNYFSLRKTIKSTIIKGDTLIFNSLNKTSNVTTLRSVKNVSTKTILGIQWTNIAYSFDGATRKARFISRASRLPFRPESTMKAAIKMSIKRKASLKPGPVSVK